uniref:Fibronectin type-III domain-containing protein n=1 Tax=Amphimedon queenslandica TaxID=400682 RepID=A0A1X7SMV2_AMPQE
MSSFGFGFPKPVTNIKSSIDNCSTINVSWNAATGDNNLYYNLSIYDAITGQFLRSVSVYDTSYQFLDNNLFIHRYTYVITGVNELGEGISNNDTFSYQRVPRAVQNTSLDILYYTQDVVIVQFCIPQIILECTGEAPEHVTVTVQCNGTDSSTTCQIRNMNDITGLISVPQYQQCNISIVFSSEAGSSEPFILAFGEYILHY